MSTNSFPQFSFIPKDVNDKEREDSRKKSDKKDRHSRHRHRERSRRGSSSSRKYESGHSRRRGHQERDKYDKDDRGGKRYKRSHNPNLINRYDDDDGELFVIDTFGSNEKNSEIRYKRLGLLLGQPGWIVSDEGTVETPIDTRRSRIYKRVPLEKDTFVIDYEGEFVPIVEFLTTLKQLIRHDLDQNPNAELWHRYINNEKRLLLCTNELHASLMDEKIHSMYKTAYTQLSTDYSLAKEYINHSLSTNKPAKWKKFASTNCDNIDGFINWIDAKFESTSGKNVNEVIDELIQDNLLDISLKNETVFINVVYTVCCYLRNAGHYERATGIYQALIEYNLFRPTSIKSEVTAKAAFSAYWGMETNRFGDKDAKKWCDTEENELVAVTTATNFPIRSVKVHTNNDLHRVVLYTDIEPFVNSMTDTASLLFSMFTFFGISTPFYDPQIDYYLPFKDNYEIVIELIRQLTHSPVSLPEYYIQWSFLFLSTHDSEFYKKYVQFILKRYQSCTLYQLHSSILRRKFNDFNTASTIANNLGMFKITTDAVYQLAMDEYELCDIPNIELILSYGIDSDIVIQFIKSLSDDTNTDNIQNSLTTFWLSSPPPTNIQIITIGKILLHHCIKRLNFGIKLARWHIQTAIEDIPHSYMPLRDLISEARYYNIPPPDNFLQPDDPFKTLSVLSTLETLIQNNDYHIARDLYFKILQSPRGAWCSDIYYKYSRRMSLILSTSETRLIENTAFEKDLIERI